MRTIRQPAVAGTFYPGRREDLRVQLGEFLAVASRKGGGGVPKAMILPHAGYVFSGPVAASGYACLEGAEIERVVLVGPSHHVALTGLAVSAMDAFFTPLGEVPLDRESIEAIASFSQVRVLEGAHAHEHSLEVHLPFLQEQLGEFKLVPLVVGAATPEEVSEVLEHLWGGPETLIVVSSDLSHYLDYESAREADTATCRKIEALDHAGLRPDEACGCRAVGGLLLAARKHGLRATTLDLRNSGDTAGPRDQVVGYGAWRFD